MGARSGDGRRVHARRGQRRPGEHLLAPRVLKIPPQVLEDELGRAAPPVAA